MGAKRVRRDVNGRRRPLRAIWHGAEVGRHDVNGRRCPPSGE
jgi:hypothetical protein